MLKGTVQILEDWIDGILENVHTTIPGRIEMYYGHEKRRAKVKPLIKQINGGKVNVALEIPPIDNVPVVFPSSSLFSMLWPLSKGDNCMLHFAETGMGNFLNSDGQNPVNADDISRFSLTDCICVPGLYAFGNTPIKPTSDDDFIIQFAGKTFIIEKDSDIITIKNEEGAEYKLNAANAEINGNSKSFVTHAELDAALQTFINALNLHTHPETGGSTLPPTTPLSLDISASETQTVKTGG
jgi:hypothetical protein